MKTDLQYVILKALVTTLQSKVDDLEAENKSLRGLPQEGDNCLVKWESEDHGLCPDCEGPVYLACNKILKENAISSRGD